MTVIYKTVLFRARFETVHNFMIVHRKIMLSTHGTDFNLKLASSGQMWRDVYNIFSFIGQVDTATNFVPRIVSVLTWIVYFYACLSVQFLYG